MSTVLTREQLKGLCPFSDSHLYRLEASGEFPKRIRIGKRRVVWDADEVDAWIESKKSDRDRSRCN